MRRTALFLLIGFVTAGVLLLVFLSLFWIPSQYREQAARLIAPTIRAAQIGDVVYLGVYEQDNDRSNGPEPIEWIVLDKRENRSLLASRCGLDCIPFNAVETFTTWDRSSVRTWLNSTFYYSAFSGAERSMLVRSDQTTDTNPYFDTYGGSVTHERIFLANISQAVQYMPTEKSRMCKPTAYAAAHDVSMDETAGTCTWWLRSPGFDTTAAARVAADGQINYSGVRVQSDHQAVRPWIWVTHDPKNTTPED